MSYAIVRMVKVKSHALKGMQFHNQRERPSQTNPDIEASRSHENYDLVNARPIDYNKHVKEIISSQKTGTRKTRKDAVLVNEFLITSDSPFFAALSPAAQRRFFTESLAFFQTRYGKQNIAYAVVHVDEKTPHMHLGIVPMREGRLQSKNIFNRQELLWLQEQFPLHVQRQGFSLIRGEKGSNRAHIDMQRFKKQALEQELNTLTTHVTKKKQELAAVTDIVPTTEYPIAIIGHEVKTKVIPHFFGKDDVIHQTTRNVIMSPEEIEKLKQVVQTAAWVKHDYQRLLTVDLVQENERLHAQVNKLQAQTDTLQQQNETLIKEVSRLRGLVSDLRDEIVQIYLNTHSFIKARTPNVSTLKTFVNELVYQIQQHLPKSEFAQIHEYVQHHQQPTHQAESPSRGMER